MEYFFETIWFILRKIAGLHGAIRMNDILFFLIALAAVVFISVDKISSH